LAAESGSKDKPDHRRIQAAFLVRRAFLTPSVAHVIAERFLARLAVALRVFDRIAEPRR
jgi:hypothetical protein